MPFPLSCLAFRVGKPAGREPLPLDPFPFVFILLSALA